MESSQAKVSAELESQPPLPPPPPPTNPTNVVPVANRWPMVRRSSGAKGRRIQLLTNHFKVGLKLIKDAHFYQYDVAFFYVDYRSDGTSVDCPANAADVGRKVLDQVFKMYLAELLDGKNYAYDGEATLYTMTLLPNKDDYEVAMEDISSNKIGVNSRPDGPENDQKRTRRQARSKTFKVQIRYAAKIPVQAIQDGLCGQESNQVDGAMRVLDIILRQHAARQGCLLVHQAFFDDHPINYIGGGVQDCRGFHSSFRVTQGGLFLNVDVSTTILVKPGPVLEFLLMNQDVTNPKKIDWTKARSVLKNLRIKVNNIEYKINGLSEATCRNQKFALKQGRNGDGVMQSVEITVSEYFERLKHIRLRNSADMPCINVGKPKRPCYFPIELCSLVSLQRYTKALTNLQRATLAEKARQKPQERKQILGDLLRNSKYDKEPMLQSSGIAIDYPFTLVEGRVLPAPRLTAGNGEDFFPRNGRWNFNNKKLNRPVEIKFWCIVSFSDRYDIEGLYSSLKRCAEMKGFNLSNPVSMIEETAVNKPQPAPIRVEKMFNSIKRKVSEWPQFLLCILPERKTSDIYGPWKKINLVEGIVTQCIAPAKVNDQYLTNVLLKINAKLGGLNFLLSIDHRNSIPLVSKKPTIIIGMDVTHGSPDGSDMPSIAAVVSSRCWPSICRYRASVRIQSARHEMIDNLFNPLPDKKDSGIIRELLDDFYESSNSNKPRNIIIFRDGVSETQFNQVLNIELEQIIQACKYLDDTWFPKFTVIIAQKRHHTRFFQAGSKDNVLPGTVIDKNICHPKLNDFYLSAHAGMIGTTRPTHYHILHDEVGFSADALQQLVHSLSYVSQRSTTAISVVAPIRYAHLAAAQMAQVIKFDEIAETSSSRHDGVVRVPQLPCLHPKVKDSMFFC